MLVYKEHKGLRLNYDVRVTAINEVDVTVSLAVQLEGFDWIASAPNLDFDAMSAVLTDLGVETQVTLNLLDLAVNEAVAMSPFA